ncbi:hypothetical protein TRIP_C20055 [Candidatus Zixiibacteriota bacterium]|nr:hypothetical protein TRIP_C20055 [candidate division Zixibacteria bacterium]
MIREWWLDVIFCEKENQVNLAHIGENDILVNGNLRIMASLYFDVQDR